MPTYEYHCEECGKTFELFQSMKDARLTTCTCGKKGRVRRLVGRGAGIIFKGSGFYENDYRRAGTRTGHGEAGGQDGSKGADKPVPPPVGPTTSTPSPAPAKQ